jgi:hypothetical protein
VKRLYTVVGGRQYRAGGEQRYFDTHMVDQRVVLINRDLDTDPP